MKVVIQRCERAEVRVNKEIIGQIKKGLMILVGFTEGDDDAKIAYMVDKIINLRIFDDEDGVMNKSLKEIGGEILSISQFTLYADTSKGRRPSYVKALSGDLATKLYDQFNHQIKLSGIPVKTGVFGATMQVDFINDGPVTIIIEK